MPAAGVLLLAGVAVVVGLRAPVRWALALLVATTVLVPSTLVVPNGLSSYPTVGRVVLLAVAVNLLRRDLPMGATRFTPIHVALAALVVASLACGVALAAPTTATEAALGTFAGVLEQLLFFSVVLVAVRVVDDPKWVLGLVAAVAVASAGIAVVEHLVGGSWGRFLTGGRGGTDAAKPLDVRNGEVRVRAGAQFALQFAWVSAALLPVVVARAARSRGVAWWFGVGAVVLAVVWSGSRSAVPAMGVAVVVLWLAGRGHRRIGAALVVGALAVLLVPSLVGDLGRDVDEGSIESRELKVPAVLSFVADDPWTGLGHNGLDALGVFSTDNSFLLAYAETGVLGAAALVVALGAGLGFAVRGLRRSRGDDLLLQAAAATGAVTLVAGALAFDAFSLQGSAGPFWMLVAIAVVGGERVVGTYEPAPIPRERVWWPVAGLAVGVVVLALAPTHRSASLRADALPVRSVAAAPDPQVMLGRRLVDTGCRAAEAAAAELGASSTCRALDVPGSLLLRLEGGDVDQAALAATDALHVALDEVEVHPTGPVEEGRPTAATTAPVVLALLGAAAAVLVPARRRSLVPV